MKKTKFPMIVAYIFSKKGFQKYLKMKKVNEKLQIKT